MACSLLMFKNYYVNILYFILYILTSNFVFVLLWTFSVKKYIMLVKTVKYVTHFPAILKSVNVTSVNTI
jgi:hypothetical protein